MPPTVTRESGRAASGVVVVRAQVRADPSRQGRTGGARIPSDRSGRRPTRASSPGRYEAPGTAVETEKKDDDEGPRGLGAPRRSGTLPWLLGPSRTRTGPKVADVLVESRRPRERFAMTCEKSTVHTGLLTLLLLLRRCPGDPFWGRGARRQATPRLTLGPRRHQRSEDRPRCRPGRQDETSRRPWPTPAPVGGASSLGVVAGTGWAQGTRGGTAGRRAGGGGD